MKLHKVSLVAQGFSCSAVVILSSKNIYSPKPNCLPRDTGVGVVCVCVCVCVCERECMRVRLCTTEHTENALLARPETTQQIVSH